MDGRGGWSVQLVKMFITFSPNHGGTPAPLFCYLYILFLQLFGFIAFKFGYTIFLWSNTMTISFITWFVAATIWEWPLIKGSVYPAQYELLTLCKIEDFDKSQLEGLMLEWCMWIMMFYTGLKQTSNFLVWKPLICYIHDSSSPFPCFLLPVTSQVLHASGKCQTLDSSRDVVLLHADSTMVMSIPSWGCLSAALVIAVATEVGECRALWGQAWAPTVHEKLHMQHAVLYACSVAVAISAVRFAHSHSLLHLSFSSIGCGYSPGSQFL